MKTIHKTLIPLFSLLFLGSLGSGIYFFVNGKNNKDLSEDKKTEYKKIGFWLLVASAIVFGLFLSPTVVHGLCTHSFQFINPMTYFRRNKKTGVDAVISNPPHSATVKHDFGSGVRQRFY